MFFFTKHTPWVSQCFCFLLLKTLSGSAFLFTAVRSPAWIRFFCFLNKKPACGSVFKFIFIQEIQPGVIFLSPILENPTWVSVYVSDHKGILPVGQIKHFSVLLLKIQPAACAIRYFYFLILRYTRRRLVLDVYPTSDSSHGRVGVAVCFCLPRQYLQLDFAS